MRNSTFDSGPRSALVNSSSYGGKIREVVKDQFEAFEVLRGFGGKNNLVSHSGHNIARFTFHVKPGRV